VAGRAAASTRARAAAGRSLQPVVRYCAAWRHAAHFALTAATGAQVEQVLVWPDTAVQVEAGAPLPVLADPDQLEQASINLLRNAVEASLPGGQVLMRWPRCGCHWHGAALLAEAIVVEQVLPTLTRIAG